MFIYSNCNTVLLSYYIKNQLDILQVFINTCDFYYVLLYIDIDFLTHNYIFLLDIKKYVNNIYASILLIKKK
jgi:hypothetical protein